MSPLVVKKWSGWASVLGSVLFSVAFLGATLFADDVPPYTFGVEDQVAIGLLLLSILLLAAGVAGLYARYAAVTGALGRLGLITILVALALVLAGAAGFVGEITGWFQLDSWYMWVIGLFGMPVGGVLFSLAGLRAGLAPRGAALTTIAGAVSSTLAFAVLVFVGDNAIARIGQAIQFAGISALFLFFAGWAWLGYATASREPDVLVKPQALAG